MNKATAIHGQLTSKLSTWATARSPKLTVMFEGQPSTPPTGTYLREWLMLATPRAAGVGNTAPNYVDGVFQVDVVADATGWGAAYGIADEIAGQFARGTYLTATGLRITCKSVATGPAMREESKYVLPVSINFYVYADV